LSSPKSDEHIRILIGGSIVVFIWAVYLVRVIWNVGPSRDYEGNQSPAYHYLVGALIVTGMVAAWIVLRHAWKQK
jgi:hypothetical protein